MTRSDQPRTVRATLLTVSAAVACLLLIASMNVGTLLVGHGLRRTREAAIRAAIGCARGRLVRQFLTESAMLAIVSGGFGLVLAAAATRLFVAWNPLGALPPSAIRIDGRAFGFAPVVTAVTVIVAGLTPAVRMAATDPNDVLRGGGDRGTTGASAQRTQGVLLAAQIAVSVILLVATMLLARTFVRLQSEPLGFDAANLTVASLTLPADEYDSSANRNTFFRLLAERLRALPGVARVAAGTSPPLFSGSVVPVRLTADESSAAPQMSAQDVTTEFFATMGIPLIAGRAFDDRDSSTSPAVVVLNEWAAATLFGAADAALGRRIRVGAAEWREVIGVVRNTRSTFYNTVELLTNPVIYLPAPQAFAVPRDPAVRSFGMHVHVRADRVLSMAEIRAAAASVNSRVAVTEVRGATEALVEATRQPAFRMALLAWFAAASLLLAAIGIYGVVVQGVAHRTREIGIRLALGAESTRVIATVTRAVLVAVAIGLAAGCATAIALGRVLQGLLYGIRATDATSFASAAAVLLAVALVAAFVPALRATRINPIEALRAE